jgi:hypothetical protein
MAKEPKPLPAALTDPNLNGARAARAFTQGIDLASESLNQVSANYHSRIGNPMFIQASNQMTPEKARSLGRSMMNITSPFTDSEMDMLRNGARLTEIKSLLAKEGFLHREKVGSIFTNGIL